MKKILVTTDFSTASKAGMRFAIQLATQTDVELVFFHCFQALIPTTVLHERLESALKKQGDAMMAKLERFVAGVHKSMKIRPGAHRCAVVESLDPEKAIMAYAEEHGFEYICMSTHGAGTLRKIIGTHSGSILRRSQVPVWVVPPGYRARPIKKMLYATDLENFDPEMTVVSGLADRLNVKTDLAHFYFSGEISLNRENLEEMWRRKYPALGTVILQAYDLNETFPEQLHQVVKKSRPDLVVFFTHVSKTWFEKFFGVSFSEKMSFVTKTPMLVYKKPT